jgi:beta,beta-carotene 9',10'-dioxygenase
MVASTQPNYVQPGFRQNMNERHIENLPIKGVIPDWLEGSLIRNGPGMVNVDKPMRHWFDGLAMLHRFSFSGGKVDYRSKFVDCQAYRDVKKYGKITYSDFATDPCRSLFQKVQVVFENPPKITDSAKVNVDQIGDKAFALGEPLMQIQFDPDTLDSLGVFHYEKKTGNRMNTAHPHTDGHDAFNLVVEYGPINYYKIYSIADGVEEVASVPVLEPGYLHSFGMSKNYFIIAEYPLLVQSLKLLFRQRPFIENFNWKPNKGTRFLVIDRATGKLKTTIKTEALFSFHHVNAFEKEGKLMVDLVSYSDASIIDQYYINRLESKDLQLPFGRLERFVLDLEKGSLQERKPSREPASNCLILTMQIITGTMTTDMSTVAGSIQKNGTNSTTNWSKSMFRPEFLPPGIIRAVSRGKRYLFLLPIGRPRTMGYCSAWSSMQTNGTRSCSFWMPET